MVILWVREGMVDGDTVVGRASIREEMEGSLHLQGNPQIQQKGTSSAVRFLYDGSRGRQLSLESH